MQPKVLRQKRGVELGAERHQLRLDALEARSRSQRAEHFGQQALGDRALRMLGGDEKSADQALVILEDVEAVACGMAIFQRGVSAQGPGIDELPNQVDGWSIVPLQLVPPTLGFLSK